MEDKEVKKWVGEAIKPHSFIKFNDDQINNVVEQVIRNGIIENYENAFITEKEAENMILHIAYELANKFPNPGAFPKAPREGDNPVSHE